MHWNLTQCPFYENPHHGASCSPLAFWPCAASCPGRVLARNPFGRLLHLLPCATFFAAKVSVSQAPSPNAVPRRHASPGTRKAIWPISDRKLPYGGTAPKSSLPNRALSESGFAHDTPATLCMKRQTTYIFVIDISSLRLKSPLPLEPSSGGRRSAPGSWI